MICKSEDPGSDRPLLQLGKRLVIVQKNERTEVEGEKITFLFTT